MADFLSVGYTTNNHVFQAVGFTIDYQNGSASLQNGGDYDLTAYITSAGMLTNGSLTIRGDIGSGDELLLSGTLNTGAEGIAFGATAVGSGLFEFQFTVTGGESVVVSDFGGIGAVNRGVILHPEFSGGEFSDSWGSNFSSSGQAFSDNFVPEPSSYLLLVFAGAMCVATHRCRKHTRVPKSA